MKKIIKPKYAKFKRECWHCGCIFEYSLDDVGGFGAFVICPCCHKQCSHDAEIFGVVREGEQND